jgi:hypothetical protein
MLFPDECIWLPPMQANCRKLRDPVEKKSL